MKPKTLTIILGILFLISLASAEVISITSGNLENLSFYSGETIYKNITIETDGNYLVYLSWNTTGNESDMEGFNISYESPIQVNTTKTIQINISTAQNFKPDNFTLNFYASTEKAEEIIEKEFNQSEIIKIPAVNLTLDINSSGTGNVTVKTFKKNPESGFRIPDLNIFFHINASENITNGMNETILEVSYTDAEVNALGIDESTLRLYFYNETLGDWVMKSGGVNVVNNFVWANTNHFSTWGVFGNLIPAATTETNSGGGGSSTIWPKKVINETIVNETVINETVSNETEPEEEISPLRKRINTITGGVIGVATEGGTTRDVVMIIIIVGGVLILFSQFYGGMPGTSCFTRATNFHKRAEKAHMKGKYTQSGKLYNKAQILREKGERISFRGGRYGKI